MLLLFSGFGALQWRAADRSQIQARVTSSRANFGLNRDTLDTLSEALIAGKKLQQSIWFRNDSTLRAEVMEVLAEATYWVRERNHWEGHNTYVNSVSFSPDRQPQAQIIATGADDGIVKLWNLDGTEIKTKKQLRHSQSVFAVSFSPDGQILASASNDGVVKLWKRDGTLLVSASYDKTVRLWQPNYSYLIPIRHPSSVRVVNFSPDGQKLVTADIDNNVSLWKPNGDLLKTMSPLAQKQNLPLNDVVTEALKTAGEFFSKSFSKPSQSLNSKPSADASATTTMFGNVPIDTIDTLAKESLKRTTGLL